MARALQAAVAGLEYPSESDEPFDVFVWNATAADKLSARLAREAVAAHVQAGRAIEEQPIEQFFGDLADSDQAARFDQLRQIAYAQLRDPRVLRVGAGEVRVDVYLLGQTPTGDWAGVHTVSVET